MADRLTKEQRSKLMKSIKSRDSDIEVKLRRALWAKGYRYRKNYRKLPGSPDIVFVSAKIAVFCDGEYWHGKDWDKRRDVERTNKQFWINKIESNMRRDTEVNRRLDELGWMVLRFWGKDIMKNTEDCIAKIECKLKDKT